MDMASVPAERCLTEPARDTGRTAEAEIGIKLFALRSAAALEAMAKESTGVVVGARASDIGCVSLELESRI